MFDNSIIEFVNSALAEDIGRGDLFASLAPNTNFNAVIKAKSDGIISGMKYIKAIAKIANIQIEIIKNDGVSVQQNEIILKLNAHASTLLSTERTILDILQHSSGIATNVNEYVQKLKNSNIVLLDTRKTRPLLREFEKYSVLNGGGVNHRKGLDDSLMLKDTHLKTIKDLKTFMIEARAKIPWTSKIEIECETLLDATDAMSSGADIVMCDNMDLDTIKKVVDYKIEHYSHVLIEVSGNITKSNIDKYLDLGIDAISSGSMIHQATWLDFSMKIE